MNQEKFKESYSSIKRSFNLKMMGGGPLFPIPAEHEKSIVDIDESCKRFKLKQAQQLKNAWAESKRYTQGYRFDPKLTSNGSPHNLPESRNRFRVGVPLVENSMENDINNQKLRDVFTKSYFVRMKNSPKGRKSVKDGGIVKIVRGEEGGFKNLGKHNERLELSGILQKFETIRADRDKYNLEDR
mmetsp:Transcript_32244/g.49345  ORF Transcript_32244/g.49345 Transcript_32244/m.49345 type:complete len:185 (+) Transcript_32244:1836-2390(+)